MTVGDLIELLSGFSQNARVKILVKPTFGPDLCGNYGDFNPRKHVRHLDYEDEEVLCPDDASAVFLGSTGE